MSLLFNWIKPPQVPLILATDLYKNTVVCLFLERYLRLHGYEAVEMVKYLLQHGAANINHENLENGTALHYIVENMVRQTFWKISLNKMLMLILRPVKMKLLFSLHNVSLEIVKYIIEHDGDVIC